MAKSLADKLKEKEYRGIRGLVPPSNYPSPKPASPDLPAVGQRPQDLEKEQAPVEQTTEQAPKQADPYALDLSEQEAQKEELAKRIKAMTATDEKTLLEDLNKTIQSKYKTLEDDDRKWLDEKKSQFGAMYKEALEAKKEGMTRLQWAQVAETLAQALAQVGYATSVMGSDAQNIPALRLQRGDWGQQFAQVQDAYKDQLTDIRRQEGDVEDKEKRTAGLRREAAREEINLLAKAYVNHRKDVEELKDNKDRLEARIQKAQERYAQTKDKAAEKELLAAQKEQEKQQREATQVLGKLEEARLLAEEHKDTSSSKKKAQLEQKIFRLLPATHKDMAQFKEGSEQRGSEGGWFSSAKPDLLEKYISNIEKDYRSIQEGKQPEQKELSGEDKAAYEWAQSNPNDPRAKAILDRLGK